LKRPLGVTFNLKRETYNSPRMDIIPLIV